MDRKIIDNITISISTILLLLGIENLLQEKLYAFAVPMVLIGIVIILFGPKIVKDFNNNAFKKILTNSVGLMCVILGIDYFLEANIGQYGWVYILVSLIIFNYHGNITKMVN